MFARAYSPGKHLFYVLSPREESNVFSTQTRLRSGARKTMTWGVIKTMMGLTPQVRPIKRARYGTETDLDGAQNGQKSRARVASHSQNRQSSHNRHDDIDTDNN